MKKRIFAAIAVIVMTAALSGCVIPKFTTDKYYRGRGKAQEFTYDVGSFTSLDLYSDAVLIYKKGECAPVKIEMQANLQECFTVEVTEGSLRISEQGNVITDILPRVTITAPEFEQAFIIANSVSEESDEIKAERIIFAASDGTVNVDANELRVLTAVGEVTVKGSAEKATLVLWGDIIINGIDLNVREAQVSLNGKASVSISCSEKLEIDMFGDGDFTYKGDPKITQNITGTGRLIKID